MLKLDLVLGVCDELWGPARFMLPRVLGRVRWIQIVVLSDTFIVQVIIPKLVFALIWLVKVR